MNEQNAAASARMIKGATIAMVDGSYFDFSYPDATGMTIEDYAYALAATGRSRGQTTYQGKRCIYVVAQHCVEGTEQMLADGYSNEQAFWFLMHESDEVPLGDMVGPAKPLLPDYKALAKQCGAAIDKRFDVSIADKDLIKHYDIRMLATEKRDLMSFTKGEGWIWTEGYEPFERRIVPDATPVVSAERFLDLYYRLAQPKGHLTDD